MSNIALQTFLNRWIQNSFFMDYVNDMYILCGIFFIYLEILYNLIENKLCLLKASEFIIVYTFFHVVTIIVGFTNALFTFIE
jgi:hypothetical protein